MKPAERRRKRGEDTAMRLIARINPFKGKSMPKRLMDELKDAIPEPMGRKVKLPDPPSGKRVRTSLLALAGAAGVTAASAGVSSLRHRVEASNGGS